MEHNQANLAHPPTAMAASGASSAAVGAVCRSLGSMLHRLVLPQWQKMTPRSCLGVTTCRPGTSELVDIHSAETAAGADLIAARVLEHRLN